MTSLELNQFYRYFYNFFWWNRLIIWIIFCLVFVEMVVESRTFETTHLANYARLSFIKIFFFCDDVWKCLKSKFHGWTFLFDEFFSARIRKRLTLLLKFWFRFTPLNGQLWNMMIRWCHVINCCKSLENIFISRAKFNLISSLFQFDFDILRYWILLWLERLIIFLCKRCWVEFLLNNWNYWV